jgi:hypothetical protein
MTSTFSTRIAGLGPALAFPVPAAAAKDVQGFPGEAVRWPW